MDDIKDLINEPSMRSFGQNLAGRIDVNEMSLDLDYLNHFPLNSKQCIYVVDWSRPTMVYSRGHESLFGYGKEDYNLDLVLDYYHPQDKEIVQRIIKAVLAFSSTRISEIGKDAMTLVCRIRKNDGNYIKVLRQSVVHTTNDEGKMVTSFSLLTDISFLENYHSVEWDFDSDNLNKELFKKQIYTAFKTMFTKREKQIIRLIERGMTTPEIADYLFISTHTVSTHRKNIMKKGNCSSGNELLHFSRVNGIL